MLFLVCCILSQNPCPTVPVQSNKLLRSLVHNLGGEYRATEQEVQIVIFDEKSLVKDEHVSTILDQGGVCFLSVRGKELTDKSLQSCEKMARLKNLGITKAKLTDQGVASFLRVRSDLLHLAFGFNNLTDKAFGDLGRSRNCRYLRLTETKLTNTTLIEIKKMSNLKKLYLEGTAVDDAGLKHLARLKHLFVLDLSRTRVTGRNFGEMVVLPKLSYLCLAGCPISDKYVDTIPNQSGLDYLDVSFTPLTDRCIPLFSGFTHLDSLEITGTKITEEGVSRLQKILPKCSIVTAKTHAEDKALRKELGFDE